MRARARKTGARLAACAGLIAAATAGASPLATAPLGAAGSPNAAVTVAHAHGAAGPIDILLDQRICAARNVTYGSLSRRLSVPAGPHTFSVRPANGSCSGGGDLVAGTLQVTAGADAVLIVRPTAAGGAGLHARAVDLSAVPTYRARVRVHNDTAGATVSATIARSSSPSTPQLEVVGLEAGRGTAAAEIVRGEDYRVEVSTEWGVVSAPLDAMAHWVFDIHVMGSGPGDLRLVVQRAPAANAEL
jgi:hypothetical protein